MERLYEIKEYIAKLGSIIETSELEDREIFIFKKKLEELEKTIYSATKHKTQVPQTRAPRVNGKQEGEGGEVFTRNKSTEPRLNLSRS